MNKVIWTNGCFDILHRGHIELFKYAKSLGDVLVVGIDSDARIRKSKGRMRPINKLEDRVEILTSIKYIDRVVRFDSDEELEAKVLASGAVTMVIGSDYKNKKVIGSQYVKEIMFYRKIDGYSTTKILEHSSSR